MSNLLLVIDGLIDVYGGMIDYITEFEVEALPLNICGQVFEIHVGRHVKHWPKFWRQQEETLSLSSLSRGTNKWFIDSLNSWICFWKCECIFIIIVSWKILLFIIWSLLIILIFPDLCTCWTKDDQSYFSNPNTCLIATSGVLSLCFSMQILHQLQEQVLSLVLRQQGFLQEVCKEPCHHTQR